jgi:hypothetical protein
VLHLEIALGYQHRGVEEALAGGPHRATMSQMETVAGDTTIAHATAYATGARSARRDGSAVARAMAAGRSRSNWNGSPTTPATSARWPTTWRFCRPPRRAARFAAIFSISPRCFAATVSGAAWCGPAAAATIWNRNARRSCSNGSKRRSADVQQAAAWLWDAASVRARFENGRRLSRKAGRRIGLVGPAARACGLVRDVRFDHPAGWHRFAQVPVAVWPGGDVFARARVRWLEISARAKFLREQLAAPPTGKCAVNCSPAGDTLAVALVEGWRGEVCHVALTDAGRPVPPLQDHRPVVPQLDRAGAGAARAGHLGFPDLQQELQPELLRLRS